MNVLDLFSGIGGFSLGLERAGMRTVAFCEIEERRRSDLRRHWPNVRCYRDVCELTAGRLRADGISVDVIAGGFPCQDISIASGGGDGLDGERSGLWRECARLVGEIRPRFVIVENTPALLWRGLGRVLGDLADLGFDADWDCISAAAIGAPHERNRLWLVAYPCGDRVGELAGRQYRADFARHAAEIALGRTAGTPWAQAVGFSGGVAELVRNAESWGDDDGVSEGLDGLGNAVVPQIPEIIGRAILESERLMAC